MSIAIHEGTAGTFQKPQSVAPSRVRGELAPLRLTSRGRVLVSAVAVSVVATGALIFGSAGAATDEPGQAVTTITIQPGQTLWSIAAELRPSDDIRATVDEIIRLNALESGSKLPIGAKLALPAVD